MLELCGRIGDLNDEVLKLKRQLKDVGQALEEPPGKKRKLDVDTEKLSHVKRDLPITASVESTKGVARTQSLASLEVRDISFILPQRKKYNLAFRPGSNGEDGGMTLEPPTDNNDKQLMGSHSIRWLDIGMFVGF